MATIDEINARLDRIEKIAALSAKRILNYDDLALLLGKSKQTLYNNIDIIPHYTNEMGVWFKREEIERWQCQVKCNPIKL